MLGSSAEVKSFPRLADFYHGKNVFLTGATGFVGSVLLEILLRCCPGIKSIYILLRSKKNALPKARKEQIFNKKVWKKEFLCLMLNVISKVIINLPFRI
ncbi:hypothetical protein AVEN_21412-1 [Araneus ventricosus]|uniref:Fatty acyl-CoA reductase n=1 Tax=Araneus ventricosus TaxID=182803 RepID=A0A4Y2JUM7_ARAVE|nr:hypothetical protein AVEN_21412-1 [Araneus ventricosus]